MRTKQVFFVVLSLILLAGVVSVDAAGRETSTANLPWVKEYVEWNKDRGLHVSMVNHPKYGKAYMSYYDSNTKDLMMASEVTPGTGNCGPKDSWYCTLVDSEGDVGHFSSIDVVYYSGMLLNYTKIGISYYDATNGALKYAQRTYPGAGWTITEVDSRGYVNYEYRGTYTSLKFNEQNNPVIGYHAYSYSVGNEYGAVKVASFVPAGGAGINCNSVTENWECETVDRFDGEGFQGHGSHVSIDFSYGNTFYVAFYNSEMYSLDYAWKQLYGGSCSNSAWNCVTIDYHGTPGKYISLHAPDNDEDKLQLAYFDPDYNEVRYAYFVGSGGNCTNPAFNCEWVDKGLIFGEIAMEMDAEGLPIIAYIKASDDLLPAGIKIARPSFLYGLAAGNCGEIPAGLYTPVWRCDTIDSMLEGYGYTHAAGHLDVSVNSAGLIKVAYAESDDYENTINLKVARQQISIFLPIVLK